MDSDLIPATINSTTEDLTALCFVRTIAFPNYFIFQNNDQKRHFNTAPN